MRGLSPPPDPPPDSKRSPKRDSAPELSEVERAISVLHGRHPEHERVRREDEETKAARAAENAAAHRLATRAMLVRRLKIGAVAFVVLCALAVIAKSARKESQRTEALERASEPFTSKGFALVETSGRGDPTKLEADVEAGCLVAATAKPARLKLAYTGGFIEGEGSVLTCLCEPGKVTVTSERSGEGLVLLHREAASIGGSRAFYFLPFKVGATGYSDQNCAESSLDGWIDAKKWLTLTPDEKWLEAPERKPLKAAGFTVAGSVKAELPFGVIEIPANTCTLLVDESGVAKTSVRLKGGGLAVGPATGTVAWCTSAATTAVAQREGKSELRILVAPAARAGGLWGVRDAAEKSGVRISAMSVPAADRDWIAKQLLLASAIPESLITVGVEEKEKSDEARIAAASVEKAGTLVADTAEGVFSFCDPPLGESTVSLCVFSGPQRWKIEGADSVAGLARAKTPFWLFGLQNASEPAALKRATQIITLARVLHRDGFEPTTIEAVTETEKGAEVLGRANEDAIVVVTLAPMEPWAIPLSDGAEWSLDAGAPRVVPLKPLERVTVVAPPKTKLPPREKRRTVVFRRHI